MSTASPAKPKLPRLPSLQEMEQLMRERMPGLKAYSPHDDWLQLEVHGRTDLWAPPDLGGAIRPHPVTGKPTVCDGIFEVRGRYLTQKDSSGKVIEGQDANAIVRFLMSKQAYGEMGVIWLPGDQEIDESIKEASREVYREYQHHKDEEVVAKRTEFKKNWESNPAKRGRACPPPTEKELAAMDRLQERHVTVRTYLFECDLADCPGYAANDWAKFARHMERSHGYKPAELDRIKARYTSEETGFSGEPVKSEPVSPGMAEQIRKAEEEKPKSRRRR